MREINLIVVHCSATPEGREYHASDIDRWHRNRKPPLKKIGYHYLITLDGCVEVGRPEQEIGAHAQGHNNRSIGVCYIGGVDAMLQPKDTRTGEQKAALLGLLQDLKCRFPGARIVGHRDLSVDRNHDGQVTAEEWMKACPSFNAIPEYAHL